MADELSVERDRKMQVLHAMDRKMAFTCNLLTDLHNVLENKMQLLVEVRGKWATATLSASMAKLYLQ